MLNDIEHKHPLVYMRGIESKYLLYLVDFIYQGEANIAHEDLQEFLGIAQELKVSGLENTDMYGKVEHVPILTADKPSTAKLNQFNEIKEMHIKTLPKPK